MDEPTPFGKYQLRERIAVGGMAELFRATMSDADFAIPVAIKRVLPELAADETFVRMLIDEAKIASQLSHPNIAQILDLGMAEGRYYIAQEYVHGRDLAAVRHREAERGRRIPGPMVVHVLEKVCDALSHAHEARAPGRGHLGIIHRDVSPQNILLSYEGEVKVVDFGLAKATVQAQPTKTGMIKGKVAYLSPEQAHGENIDHRSDLFALGICAWEMLTGERLFARDNDADTVLAVREGNVPPIDEQAPQIPKELAAIVSRALERDRTKRFASAAEMRDALEEFRYSHGELVRPRHVAEYVRELFGDEEVEAASTGSGLRLPHTVTVPDGDAFDEDEGTTRETTTKEEAPVDADPTDVVDMRRMHDDPTRQIVSPDDDDEEDG